jgi:quercetin dioxygenase-like cupin family protein
MNNKQPKPPIALARATQNYPLPRIRVIFFILASLVLLVLSLSPASKLFAAEDNEFAGERIVHLLQEPRHRTVHNEGDLYLLDVQVNPGDTSLPHVHDQAIMLTYISMADGPRDGQIGNNTDYASEAITHKVSNAGPGLFRIIALVNGSAGNIDLQSDRPSGLSGEPELENAWFRSYRVELAPGEETKIQYHQLPSVVVQVVDGLLQVTRDDQVIDELDHPGNWSWRKAGQSYSVKNVGGIATAVVINEGRF